MVGVRFVIRLASDAEPGTGQAGSLVDDFVTRDEIGAPVLRASHLKGLMRDRLATIAATIGRLAGVGETLQTMCFGQGGAQGGDGFMGRVRVSDARTTSHETITISRTAVGSLGTAEGHTLRANEAIPVGSEFVGTLWVDGEKDSLADIAARLALLSIEAVGGKRNRGAGACHVRIEGDERGPGVLLTELGRAVAAAAPSSDVPLPAVVPPCDVSADEAPRWLLLRFNASDPVCCPETPVLGLNVIRSGCCIPASAVQGALLTLLSRDHPSLASACFVDWRFRTWPLLPVAEDTGGEARPPVRVSLSHRMSKLRNANDQHEFRDQAIEPYRWREVAAGSPLKAADGVLLRDGKRVLLWRSADMPRVVTAHGVHGGQKEPRNLFTVEAMAPMLWSGLVAMPAEAADVLRSILEKEPSAPIAFGKGRSVRGGGVLTAAAIDENAIGEGVAGDKAGKIFIVQSPVALEDASHSATRLRVDDVVQGLVADAGWGDIARSESNGAAEIWASAGFRFGWNRLGLGRTATSGHKRLRARRCILPGSVVVLDRPLDNVADQLLRGLGEGREEGFGALLPHPGLADELYERPLSPAKRTSRDASGRLGLRLWRLQQESGGGPSGSQIAEVLKPLTAEGRTGALEYLDQQLERSERTWRRWRKLATYLRKVVAEEDASTAAAALRVWQDLVVARQDDRQ